MSIDPVALVRAQRQNLGDDLEADLSGGAFELKSIPMDPASLLRRAPPPEPWSTPDMQKSATPILNAMRGELEQVVEATSQAQRRVAIYVGRGSTFRVCVEEQPDWDELWGETMSDIPTKAVVLVCRALGVKVADKTGEFGANKLTENNERAPTSIGARRAGRPRKASNQPEAS